MFQSRLAQRLNLRYPIIQAPCAPFSVAPLVAEVSNAGGLGSLSAAISSPEKIRDSIREIKQLTNKPFAVNLFAPPANPPTPDDFTNKRRYPSDDVLDTFRQELGITTPEQYTPRSYPFEDQLNVVLEEGCPVFSFTFGELPEGTIAKLKKAGTFVIGTATTVHEAKVLANRPNKEDAVDAIIAQGYEVSPFGNLFLHILVHQPIIIVFCVGRRASRQVSGHQNRMPARHNVLGSSNCGRHWLKSTSHSCWWYIRRKIVVC